MIFDACNKKREGGRRFNVYMDMAQNAILTITDEGLVKSFDLNSYGKSVVTIGRSSTCDIVCRNAKVGRNQGQFNNKGGIWFYEDLGSTNGTIINGKKATSVSLNTNDVLVFDTVQGNDSTRVDVKIVDDGNIGKGSGVELPPTPLTPPTTPPKPNWKKIAIITALSVLLVAAIVVAVILIVKKTGVHSSPEKVAVHFVEGFAQRDTDKVKESVHKKMKAEYSDLSDYEGSFNGKTIENIKAGTPINVASDDMKLYKAALKLGYDLDLDDAKIVRVTFELSDGKNTEQSSLDVVCGKIDSSWYVIGVDY